MNTGRFAADPENLVGFSGCRPSAVTCRAETRRAKRLAHYKNAPSKYCKWEDELMLHCVVVALGPVLALQVVATAPVPNSPVFSCPRQRRPDLMLVIVVQPREL